MQNCHLICIICNYFFWEWPLIFVICWSVNVISLSLSRHYLITVSFCVQVNCALIENPPDCLYHASIIDHIRIYYIDENINGLWRCVFFSSYPTIFWISGDNGFVFIHAIISYSLLVLTIILNILVFVLVKCVNNDGVALHCTILEHPSTSTPFDMFSTLTALRISFSQLLSRSVWRYLLIFGIFLEWFF